MAVNWTKEQNEAITVRGGGLLVSAAAGSGKTAVLSERVVRMLTEGEHPVDADTLLIVTFTRLAAAEMKERISRKLGALLEQNPGSRALRRQQLLLESAKISTIDAFCQGLIRENFQLLDLPYDFRVADEKELELLRADAVSEVIEDYYSRDDGRFASLVELLSGSRSDRRAEETILKLYDFIRSHPFYEEWLGQRLAMYDAATPAEQSPWGKILVDYALEGAACAATFTHQAIDEILGDEQLEKAYLDAFRQDAAQLEALEHALAGSAGWDDVLSALDGVSFPRLGRLMKYPDEARKTRITGLRDKVKDIVKELREKRFCCTSAEFAEDMQALRPDIALLFEVTQAFGHRLTQLKREKKAVDFPDLTHFALRLLVELNPQDEVVQTELALALSQRFSEVLVDEYQDTNEAQDLLFWTVSDQGRKLFMVGDVKQSIYRFRQAMPGIFLSKKEQYRPVGEGFPAKIILGKNFRSRGEITGAVNFLFSMLMSKRLGEMDYGSEDRLTAGLSYAPDAAPGCSLHLIDLSQNDVEEDSTLAEARYVGALIKDILQSGLLVEEGDFSHPVRPGDIAVLMRSPRGRAEVFLAELSALDVPAWAEAQTGFLSSLEVASVIALLKVLSNPLLDLEFAQVLLCPIFGFSADEVATLRAGNVKTPFYLLVQHGAGQGDEHCEAFLETFARLRGAAALLPASELIKRIYDETGFPDIARAMELGQVRLSNLHLLVDYARSYEEAGYRGLDGFVRFITRLEEQGSDLGTAAARGGDAVSVMSIHASKGLEFPVVILAGCARRFNAEDQRSATMLSSRLGFACKRRVGALMAQYTTLPLEALRVETASASLSEELRILYVALTRARQRLYCTAALADPGQAAANLAALPEGGRLSPWAVRSARCFADWLVMAALHHPHGAPLRHLAGLAEPEAFLSQEGSFEIVVGKPPLAQDQTIQGLCFTAPADELLLQRIEERLSFVYPHEQATLIPSKFAVSQLVHGAGQPAFSYAARPAFLTEEGLTGAERGTALHAFLQFADLATARTNPAGERQRLVERGLLTPQQAQAVEDGDVAAFLNGAIGIRMLAALQLHRELRFLCEADETLLGELAPQIQGEHKTLLQGVADCVIIEHDGAVIVDYKTDYSPSPEALAQRYAPQVRLYAKVVQGWLGVPVKECYLYSFHHKTEILINEK